MKLKWVGAWVSAALVGTASLALYAGNVLATPPVGVTSVTLGVARFDAPIDATGKTDIDPGPLVHYWKGAFHTRLASDMYVVQNTFVPGGTFGWHSHPGPTLVIVKSGTATFYMGDDPSCTPHVVQAGHGFIDQGNDVHTVRNEGSVDLVTIVVSLVPAGFARRIDQPDPGNCNF